MRVLLDNCIPERFGRLLTEHQVDGAVSLGWASLPDGQLLDVMDGQYDVLVTVDKSIPQQQNFAGRSFGVVVLRAYSNRLSDLSRLAPRLLRELKSLKPGDVRLIGR